MPAKKSDKKSENKPNKNISKKTAALLALEAKMIEKDRDIYTLENYIPEVFSEIEEVLAADKPERLLDEVELKTFQNLVFERTGGDRREGSDRREKTDKTPQKNRRDNDRRWKGSPRPESEG